MAQFLRRSSSRNIRKLYKIIFRQLPQEILRELFRRIFLSIMTQLSKKLRSQHSSGIHSSDAPRTAALEVPPPSNRNRTKGNSSLPLGMNVLHHSITLAKYMATLNRNDHFQILNLLLPGILLSTTLSLTQTTLSSPMISLISQKKVHIFLTSGEKR